MTLIKTIIAIAIKILIISMVWKVSTKGSVKGEQIKFHTRKVVLGHFSLVGLFSTMIQPLSKIVLNSQVPELGN